MAAVAAGGEGVRHVVYTALKMEPPSACLGRTPVPDGAVDGALTLVEAAAQQGGPPPPGMQVAHITGPHSWVPKESRVLRAVALLVAHQVLADVARPAPPACSAAQSSPACCGAPGRRIGPALLCWRHRSHPQILPASLLERAFLAPAETSKIEVWGSNGVRACSRMFSAVQHPVLKHNWWRVGC